MNIENTGSLKNQAMRGIAWNTMNLIGTQSIQLIVGLIMARLLAPSDYGLIGMLTIFIALSQSLVNGGFGQALIQKTTADQKDYSTVFFYNIGVSSALYGVLFFSAPYIAAFYREPVLTGLVRVIGLTFVISAFGMIQKTILTKQINFKTQAIINLISMIASAPVGIYLAYIGSGVWALVFQTLANQSIAVILFWLLAKWRPDFIFCRESFHSLFSFGSKLLFSNLLDTFYTNLHQIVIGRIFSAQSLGYYSRARQIQALPATSITQIVQSVTFPLFSKIQDDTNRLKSGFQQIIRLLSFFILPLSAIMFLTAEPFIRLVLTEKWLPTVPLIQLLATFSWLYPYHSLNLNILNVKKRSDLFLRLEIIKKILITVSIIIAIPFGITGMIYGQMVCSIIAYFINSYYSGKMIDYSWVKQLRDILPFLIAAAAACTIDLFIPWQGIPDLMLILARSSFHVTVYLGLTLVLGCREPKLVYQWLYEKFATLRQPTTKKPELNQ